MTPFSPPTTTADAFERTAIARGDAPALARKRNGRWEITTWREYHDRVRLGARALIALGVEPHDHVTIIGYNCPEWFIADYAAIMAGGIPAGIYTTNTPEQCRYVAAHCDARVAFVEDEEQLAKFRAIRSALPALRAIVVMHGEVRGDDILTWDGFLDLGRTVPDELLDARIAAQRPSDVCTLIYTSGTTGIPKGVMLTHRNITWLVSRASQIVGVKPGEDIISYLPLSHIAEQGFSLHSSAMLGTCIWFAESLETLGDTMRDVRPHHFLGVPRVWEKIQAKMEEVGAAAPPLRRRIVQWARKVGLAGGYAMQRGKSRPLMFGLADRLVFSKVRERLGLDRARTLVTGAAPISQRTLEFFLSLGLPICDVYGMSECTAITTVATPQRYRTGTAGYVIPGADVRIADDGEICIRGPHVFAGYHKDAAATAEVIDAGGWLHTGDIGEIDEDGFLRITDRKKEIIITAGGENIAPAYVEGHLKAIPVVNQAIVIGDRRRYLSVLLTLDPAKIPHIASLEGSSARTPEEAAECDHFTAYLRREIDAVNARLARVQTVKRFAVLPAELSVEGGELTPTMKLKRAVIAEKYASVIDTLYIDV
ncbi:MAG TPA: AMP-binding protein [Gemmatimonadaceae bacterium]|nr:AMP-binding protein [Gemmatimonadaceae bacterium]